MILHASRGLAAVASATFLILCTACEDGSTGQDSPESAQSSDQNLPHKPRIPLPTKKPKLPPIENIPHRCPEVAPKIPCL
jgi:hypothetical protein